MVVCGHGVSVAGGSPASATGPRLLERVLICEIVGFAVSEFRLPGVIVDLRASGQRVRAHRGDTQ